MNKTVTSNVPPPLIIRQVINGFIVEGAPSEYCGIPKDEARVFQSFAELRHFLYGYFTHRSEMLLPDAPSVA